MVEYEINARSKQGLGLRELWRYRELFYFFTWRDIKVKYKQTLLGFTWAIFQPFLMMLVFTFFFSKVLNSSLPENIPYPVFAFAGIMLWNVFSTGLSGSGNSMVSNANIIKKIYFPRLILPSSAILVAAFDFIMTLFIFTGLLLYYEIRLGLLSIIFIPLSLLLAVAATFGIGTLIAALSVKYRDFRYIVPFTIQFLLFVTPVIYPETIIQNQLIQKLLWLNPMTGPIHLIRAGIFDLVPDFEIILWSLLSSTIMVVGGLLVFRKTETYFADIA
jgi:lipopolysaccharide transport system permease protein